MPFVRGAGPGRERNGMAGRVAKKTKKRARVGLLAGLAILILLFAAGYQLMDLRARLEVAHAEETALAERVAQQRQENAALEAALERGSDPEYLQELAREQLDMVSPGQKDFYDVSN